MYPIAKPNPPECLRNFVSECANYPTETIAPFFVVSRQTVGGRAFRMAGLNSSPPIPPIRNSYGYIHRLLSRTVNRERTQIATPSSGWLVRAVTGRWIRRPPRLFRLRRRKDTPSPVQRTGLENRRQRLLGQWAGKGHRRRLRSVSRDGYMPESGSIPPLPTRAILAPKYSV